MAFASLLSVMAGAGYGFEAVSPARCTASAILTRVPASHLDRLIIVLDLAGQRHRARHGSDVGRRLDPPGDVAIEPVDLLVIELELEDFRVFFIAVVDRVHIDFLLLDPGVEGHGAGGLLVIFALDGRADCRLVLVTNGPAVRCGPELDRELHPVALGCAGIRSVRHLRRGERGAPASTTPTTVARYAVHTDFQFESWLTVFLILGCGGSVVSRLRLERIEI